MLIIYCSDYWHRRQPDAMYATEATTARDLGLATALINFEALTEEGDATLAIAAIPPADGTHPALYRGWLLKPPVYAELYAALATRGYRLINPPAAYRYCQYLPEYYAAIAPRTPRSIWLPAAGGLTIDRIMAALARFGTKPIIVKDYVKSRKHEWTTACYIPSAADRAAVESVVSTFLRLQGVDLNEGLVFREFVEYQPLATHPQSGMPLVQEYRLFILDGQVLTLSPYWEGNAYGNELPPFEAFSEIAARIPSRFFTMDVAQTRGGEWQIIELGDGQVAGLPESADLTTFYEGISLLAWA